MTVSLEAYKKHGVSKTLLRSMLQNLFGFPKEYRDLLETYHLLYWETKYFKDKLTEGVIEKDGIKYQIIYQDAPAILSKHSQVKLSFRSAAEVYDLEAYVLVRAGD